MFTTFPKTSETFLQRDVAALQAKGLNFEAVFALGRRRRISTDCRCGGFNCGGSFRFFSFIIPWNCVRRPRIVRDLFEGVLTRGAALVAEFLGEHARGRVRRLLLPGIAPGSASAGARRMGGRARDGRLVALAHVSACPTARGAHAYDIYEHGGDWWLMEKLALREFIHTSTELGRRVLIERGAAAAKIHVIRRGLNHFPVFKPLRHSRSPLRLICIARLVPKKGLDHQLKIYAALQGGRLCV